MVWRRKQRLQIIGYETRQAKCGYEEGYTDGYERRQAKFKLTEPVYNDLTKSSYKLGYEDGVFDASALG